MKRYTFTETGTGKKYTAFAENLKAAEAFLRIEYGKLGYLSIETITKL